MLPLVVKVALAYACLLSTALGAGRRFGVLAISSSPSACDPRLALGQWRACRVRGRSDLGWKRPTQRVFGGRWAVTGEDRG
jgi:hypothetical protein